jgi:hypothetical protein
MKAGFKAIDPLQPYKMYEFTGITETQNNMGHTQNLHKVKVFEKHPTKNGEYEWVFYKMDFVGESFVNVLRELNK